jgi:aspartate/methionine/tyrosine aminotransferase
VRIPERIRAIEPFLAMEVLERAYAMERAGTKVIHLEIGEPDFPAPAAAVEAARHALAAGATRYTDSRGLPELRAAIAADKTRRTGARVDPDQVLVTSGTSPALLLVFSLLIEPGDEVIVPAPHYPCYPNFVRFCGGTPVPVPADPASGWTLDPDAVRRALGPRTRAIVVGSPANPTGAVQPREVMAALASLGVPLVSDEVYDGLVYDGAHATSALEVAGGSDVYVLDGFSKRYAMTGFRLGYAIVPREALRPLQILSQNLFISAAEFVQRAGLAALAEGEATVQTMRAAYQRRRDLLVAGLRELGFGVAAPPRGAFYVLADARRFGPDSLRLAARILDEAHVAVTPGIDFGAAGEGFLRFCYANSDDAIREALARMRRVLGADAMRSEGQSG